MTTERADLAAIKARADAATPGPWGFGGRGVASMNDSEPDPLIAETDFTPRDIRDFPEGFDMLAEMRRSARNGEFIAHARTDVPDLLAEVADLRAKCERVKAVCAEYEAMRARNDDVKFGSDATIRAIHAALADADHTGPPE